MEHIEQLSQNPRTAKKKQSTAGQKRSNEVSKQKWAIVSLSSIPLVMTLGNSMLIPVLPSMEKKLSISSFQSSMIITVYSIVAIFLIPVAGYLSDHIGRKKVIIPSLIIAGIGGLVSGFASWKLEDAYWLILAGRALQGVGAAGAAPIVMPLVGDMFKNDDDVSTCLGLIETSNTFGKVLSPILGAFLAGFIWFLPFFSFPIFCAISVIMMIFLVKCPKTDEKKIPFKEFFINVKKTFTEKGRWLYAIFFIGGILMLILFGILFYLSEVFESEYGIKDVKKGLFLALPLGALCLSSFISGKIIKKNKVLMKWLTFGGIVAAALSIAALWFSIKLWYMITMFLISGVGIGLGLPCLDALITEGVEKKERGTITSIYNSMRFIGVAAGPPIIAVLMKYANHWIFILLSSLSVTAAIVALISIKPKAEA
ncbi:MFS transporter [Neobacillus sp. MM2021_6]|uniref:MFS transporter n=1 Tax=Bacillaceae TaxID=186817 RepID=UPI00140A2C27|nr:MULTISPECIES: MFS transporter [Bacillaceae]MBO0958351.1 MFS transporter [Neobacillus sp. MM2021_6]NHC17951.1 MFS transporter [Bacillus sp. MM2020_4]WML40185.1 MFS transporter [Neobacillus sp. OS1-2]